MENNGTPKTKFTTKAWFNEQLMELQSKKERVAYIYLTLTLFIVSFFGYFVLLPAFTTISNLQKQLSDNKAVYDALTTKLSHLQSLDQQYQILEPQLDLVYNAIPISSEVPSLTSQIETLARQSNLTIENYNVSPVEYYPIAGGEKLYSFVFSLTAQGQEKDIDTFIDAVSNFNRIVTIEKITTGTIQGGVLELSLSGKAYFEKK